MHRWQTLYKCDEIDSISGKSGDPEIQRPQARPPLAKRDATGALVSADGDQEIKR